MTLTEYANIDKLLIDIRSCTYCKAQLPHAPNPVIQAAADSKIAIIGQAPGQKVQKSGIPWDDQSGKELRRWLGVDTVQFYDPHLFALVPMGFCYPGKGKSGDLPPRPECAPLWHRKLFDGMPGIKLTLLIGKYAQAYYLGKAKTRSLTDTVLRFEHYLPAFFPLVHPSPRNKIWHKRNPWFSDTVVPLLQRSVSEIIGMRHADH
ncbi:uracil-DNA glycosylase family protein [Parapedobacter lycopersici]|uniref:uracil-DNA glycosylase family protein n=1 Tax=Parapedobacter lycopersici TaxID=1864939 RepID=UPI0033422170